MHMKVSVVQGIASTATYEQMETLLCIVDNPFIFYRDWDWLDRWLNGMIMQTCTPAQVVGLYCNDEYWNAVVAGDWETMESKRLEIMGSV